MDNLDTINKLPFFYILSMGRSGSTLLEFILDAHPNVNIPLESRFIIHLYSKYHKKKKWTDNDKKEFIKDLYKDKKLNDFWNFDKEKLEKDVLNTSTNISFFSLCRIITLNYVSFFEKKNITIQGNKNPIYALWTDVLYQLNKDAKFIHLVRNPMGVVASQKKLGNTKTSYLAYRWNLMNNKIETIKQKNPQNFLTIKYEDLLNSPEKTIKEVCQFLKIDFTEEMLNYHVIINKQRDLIDKENNQKKKEFFYRYLKNLVNPIEPKTSNSWKKTLSINEQKDVAFITEELASKYGYNLSQLKGSYKLNFLKVKLKNEYRFFIHRLFYRLSLSIK